MEVLLEAIEGQAPHKDTFVSMRIGDVQKQSRFASTRTYRFPDPGDGRQGFGRIEVFKRVGHLTVSFDSLDGELQDVEVPCDATQLRMRLAVKGTEAAAKEAMGPDLSAEKKGRTRLRLDAAQKYLSEHKLEEVLAEAMREVIAAKPKDPHTFLCDQIMKHRAKVPGDDLKAEKAAPPQLPEAEKAAPPPLPEANKAAPPPMPEAEKSAPPALPEAQKSAPPPAAAPGPEKAAAPKAAPPLSKFSEYYVMHFRGDTARALAAIYPLCAKAQKPAAVQKPAAPKASPIFTNFSQYYSAHMSSPVTYPALYSRFPQAQKALPEKPAAAPEAEKAVPQKEAAAPKAAAPALANFGEYYAEHFRGDAAPALASVYSLFAKAQKPAQKPAAPKAAPTLANFSAYYAAHFSGDAAPALASVYGLCAKVQKPEQKAAEKKAAPPLSNFREYYAAHFCGDAAPALASVYPLCDKVQKPAPKAEGLDLKSLRKALRARLAEACNSGELASALRACEKEVPVEELKKSIGDRLVEATATGELEKAVSLADFRAYYGAHMTGHATSALDALYPRFAKAAPAPPAAAKPAAPAAEPVPPAAKAAPEPEQAFCFRPSVGSWLARPVKVVQEASKAPAAEAPKAPAPAEAPRAAAAEAPKAAFQFKSSVGTWLSGLPKRRAAVQEQVSDGKDSTRLALGASMVKAVQTGQLMEALLAVSAPEEAADNEDSARRALGARMVEAFQTGELMEALLASSAPEEAAPAPAFQFRPSVGSWLARPGKAAAAAPPPAPQAEKAAPPSLPEAEKAAPPPLPAAEKAAPPPLPAAEKAAPAPTPEAEKAAPPPAADAPQASSGPRPVDVLPFAEYYKQHFVPTSVQRSQQERRPSAPEAAAPAVPFQLKASVGTWLAPRPPVKQAEKPFSIEQLQLTEELDAPVVAHIMELQGIIAEKDQELDRLKARMKKYGITESSRPVTPAVIKSEKGVAELLDQMPSEPVEAMLRAMPSSPTARELLRTITGEAPRPPAVDKRKSAEELVAEKEAPPAAEPAPAPAAAPVAARAEDFRLLPSVGTWSMKRRKNVLRPPSPLKEMRPPSPSKEMLSDAKERARQALAAAFVVDEESDEEEAAPPAAEKAVAPAEAPAAPQKAIQALWLLAPSVGTWLAGAPHETEAPLFRVVGRRKSSLKKLKNEDIIKSFKAEIDRKDREIRELKLQLGM